MEERLKEIISGFVRLPPDAIGPATPIDRGAVGSSILLHRMYARLAEEGIVPADYTRIKVFGDLAPNGRQANESDGRQSNGADAPSGPIPAFIASPASGDDWPSTTIGIDIEETTAMPRATDFRQEE